MRFIYPVFIALVPIICAVRICYNMSKNKENNKKTRKK